MVSRRYGKKNYHERVDKEQATYNPHVSVLIPSWNEESGLITTVETLLKSTYTNMELIIINNASTDNTHKNMKSLMQKHRRHSSLENAEEKISLRYCIEHKQGKGNALNRGIRKASGDIIISIDADCYVPSNSIANFVVHFKNPSVMAAVGNVKIGNTDTLIGVIQYLEFLFSFYFKKGDSLINSIYIIGGAAGAFRKEIFQTIGNYNTVNITEDIELTMCIQEAGMKIVYASDALVFTEGTVDIRGLIKQRLRWKRGRFETFFTHRNLFFSTQKNIVKFSLGLFCPLQYLVTYNFF